MDLASLSWLTVQKAWDLSSPLSRTAVLNLGATMTFHGGYLRPSEKTQIFILAKLQLWGSSENNLIIEES